MFFVLTRLLLWNYQQPNIAKEREEGHVPEGRDHCRNFIVRIKVSDCMMCPKQLLAIFPPRNMNVLVRIRYTDGAIKLDVLVFRKYDVADRLIKRKRR